MFRKIITYFLILAVVLPVLAAAVPLGAKVSYGESATTGTSGNSSVSSPCSFDSIVVNRIDKFLEKTFPATAGIGEEFGLMKRSPGGGSVWDCALYTITFILYEVVMGGSIWIAGLASDIFNVSIQFSLTGEIFDADKNIMIKDGWTYVRDLLNLVFIFILLYAAISTILQYGNMDIKKILPSLIVVALLVNFSLMISKMVIDASHIFAWEFYNQIDVENKEGLGGGETFANMKSSLNVKSDFKKKNLANVFIAGFNPQGLLIAGGVATTTQEEKATAAQEGKSIWKQVVEKSMKEGETIQSTLWRMAIIILLESALALFAAFILLAGAIMFVVRVVVLWMVMIFSPIAFLGIILPSMKKYSDMWWEYLINQSFFAPAFLFMFMLATKFINNKLVNSLLIPTKNNDSRMVTGLDMGEIALIFFNFLIVGFIMSMCLVVAKQLGGKTAEFGISGAHRVKGWALGAPGNALKYGLNNRLARWGWGQLADKTLDEEKGWGKKGWAKTLRNIPGVGIGLRSLGVMKKADEDKARKAAEKYAGGLSDAGFKSLKSDTSSKSFIKRLVYSGPEGAFPSSKKGYENIAIKKKAEEEKKKRIKEEREELNALKSVESDALIFKDKFKKEIEKLEESIEGFETDLVAQNYKLAKAIEEGKTTEEGLALSAIDAIKQAKLKKNAEKKIKEEKIKKIEKQETRVKELEDKEDRRKETEGLQETIKTSGSGGGGGASKSGGGGKTTP